MIGGTFICWYCNQGLPDKRQLEIHIKIEHGELAYGQREWFGCKLCYNRLYCRQQDIIKHMRKAHRVESSQPEDHLIKRAEEITLPCQLCGEMNLLSKFCKDHSIESEMNEAFSCSFCEKEFSDDKILEAHVNIEHGKQVCYQCNECRVELYLGRDTFLRHMSQIHDDDNAVDNLNLHEVKCLADIVTQCTLCKAPSLFSMFCKRHDAEITCVDCNSHTHHKCTLCAAAPLFANCQMLWKHKFSVHKDKNLFCNLCDTEGGRIIIRSPSALMKHWHEQHCTSQDEVVEHLGVGDMTLNIEVNSHYRLEEMDKDKYKLMDGDEVKYVCTECDRSYSRFFELKCHLMTHRGERNIACTICDKSFYQVSRLTEHYKRSHHMKVTRVNELKKRAEICIEGVTKYKCPMCPSITSRYDSLQQHLRVHTGERPFSCEVCGKTFLAREHLKRHFNNIHMRVGYQCNVCGRVLTDSSNLKVHMRNHTGEKKYVCEVCGKGFSQWASHYYHKFTHNEDRAFKCPYCGMTFRCPRTLTEHKKTHVMSQVKHLCETCGSEFNTRKNLLSHVKIHVTGRPHQCDVCMAKFKLRKYLIQHLKTHKPAIKMDKLNA